jgi:hypothetical protein
MAASMLVKQRHLSRIVGRRRWRRRVVGARVGGFPPATGGSMLSAVGPVDAGHPSSVRTLFGDNTPACRAPCQLA